MTTKNKMTTCHAQLESIGNRVVEAHTVLSELVGDSRIREVQDQRDELLDYVKALLYNKKSTSLDELRKAYVRIRAESNKDHGIVNRPRKPRKKKTAPKIESKPAKKTRSKLVKKSKQAQPA